MLTRMVPEADFIGAPKQSLKWWVNLKAGGQRNGSERTTS